MFGRSSNAIKGMRDVQRIKIHGGTANLSFSQIICLICNSSDAKKNLSAEEFEAFKTIFSKFRRQSKCNTVDYNGYIDMCEVIIDEFETHFPFLLVDGEHSENLELRSQIKIRKLFADGIKFKEAFIIYEDEYDNIPLYRDYDPIEHPKAKSVFNLMEQFMAKVVDQPYDRKRNVNDFGLLSGVADVIYLIVLNRYGEIDDQEETAITLYNMITLAIHGFNDMQTDVLMKKRKETVGLFFQNLLTSPVNQILGTLSEYLHDEMEAHPEKTALKQTLSDYYDGIIELISKRFCNQQREKQ